MKPFLIVGAVAIALLLLAEAVARFGLGLGNPPLSVPHPAIEYMFAPNQDVDRFGNRQLYNSMGMRSREPMPNERRILVFGDSVVNGGGLSDHENLGTTLLESRLPEVFVGNVSAGSWGPANIKAWLNEYGTVQATTIILVVSSHDIADVPTFAPLNTTTHPQHAPLFAVEELVTRYVPRYIPALAVQSAAPDPITPSSADTNAAIETTLTALRGILSLAKIEGIKVCAIHHQTLTEIDRGLEPGHAHFESFFRSANVPFRSTSEAFTTARSTAERYYRDDIHINDEGQAALVPVLQACEREAAIPDVASEGSP